MIKCYKGAMFSCYYPDYTFILKSEYVRFAVLVLTTQVHSSAGFVYTMRNTNNAVWLSEVWRLYKVKTK